MKRSIWMAGGLLVLALAGVWYFWPAGGRPVSPRPAARTLAAAAPKAAAAARPAATNAVPVPPAVVTRSAASTNREFFRLTNTKKTLAQLTTSPRAIILENALVDTAAGLSLNIPKPLRATGEPGAYVVQSRGVVNGAFRAALAGAGAQIVSYIPNNAYLVQLTTAGANALSGNPQVQAVLPYQPYFKVQSSLLGLAIDQKTLPPEQVLTLGLFPGGAAATVAQIEQLGGKILGTDHSPFGPVVRVLPDPNNWVALAQLPGVQRVEPATRREIANDLARVKMGIATDVYVTNADWLGLSGSNVLVEVNDTGIDAKHPDFTTGGSATAAGGPPVRVIGLTTNDLYDIDGHGTHVAGVIAGNGAKSYTVTNTPRGSVTNADFRGKAPSATLFSFGFMGANDTNVYYSDSVLQAIPALTNALISNNSWVNGGDNEYDLSAASYDAAVRDALPFTNGPQPVLFVFPAGNDGGGDDTGFGGVSDTILSPGTAKNVITVGSLEQYRDITNTYTPLATTNEVTAWEGETSSSDAVAGYSARGNVGIQTEGPYGRFKPDVVAPGTFVVSTRSTTWDQAAYYNPTNYHTQYSQYNQVATPEALIYGGGILPINAVALNISVQPNQHSPNPFPTNFPIYFSASGVPGPTNYDIATSNNVLSIPPGGGSVTSIAPLLNNTFVCAVGDPTNVPVNFDLIIQIVTTNDDGNLLTVLSNLNETIGPWYYYETGTSIAAPAVSGSLALMQDYFTNTLHATPSPALLKAMLINGARLTAGYNYFAITNSVNYEGWGLVNVPNSVPLGLTNTAALSTNTPMYFVDQSPTNALATGDSRTFNVKVPTPEAQSQLMRVTLAWTDPPGNPAAGIKLVNDLDLIVTNLDTGDVYYGNTFGSAATPYSLTVNSNTPPDSINNVENIWLPPPLGTNYAVTVNARNVTVNAVTLEQTNVVQDFALVVSCGDGDNTNGISVTPVAPTPANSTSLEPKVTFITSYTNGIYFNQLAGANAPWLSTNDVAIDPVAMFGTNAQLFVGQTNQWHFYVVTNTTTYTNAAFITFLPNTLSTPRMGVFQDSTANSTRPEADLNLFVSSEQGTPNGDPNAGLLTNLDLTVISNCVYGVNGDQATLARGGTKFIAYSNSLGQQVYYIGVQCQDQMAAEYGFLAVFSEKPFSQMQNGNQIVNGLLLPMPIPDGNNLHPGVGYVFGLALYPMDVGGITVTNTITHENYGDLVGSLTHGSQFAVLNNHDGLSVPAVNYTTAYNDDGMPGTVHTDGPGSLRDFRGKEAIGPWLLTEVDDAQTATGAVTGFTMSIEPHQDLTHGPALYVVPAHSWIYAYVDAPVGNTNLAIAGTNLTVEYLSAPVGPSPLEMYVKEGSEPTFADTNYLALLTNCLSGVFPSGLDPGNTVFIGPPLTPDRYFVGVYNPNDSPQEVGLWAYLGFNAAAISKVNWGSPGPVPLVDDAVMYDSQFVTNTDTIQGINIGLRVDHPRISDLVFHLISPDGTRYLLMENRGGQSTNGAGGSVVVTNIVSVTTNLTTMVTNSTVVNSSFDGMTAGDYTSGQSVNGWTVDSSQVSVATDAANAQSTNNLLALANGHISRNIPTVPGKPYTLTYYYRGPGIVGFWRGENSVADSIGGNTGYVSNNVSYVSGQVGSAFHFDGTGGFIQIPASSSLDVGKDAGMTVDCWIKPADTSIQRPLVVWTTNSPASSVTVSLGPLINPANGHYYYLLPRDTWDGAEATSERLGGYLATIRNASENDWLATNVAALDLPDQNPNIGLTAQQSGGPWSWASGEPDTFEIWYPGEPSGDGQCVNYHSVTSPTSTGWNDHSKADVLDAIAETTSGVDFWMSVAGPGSLYANLLDSTNGSHIIYSAAGVLQANQYQHVALTYDRQSGIAKLYCNGVVVANTNLGSFTPKTGGNVMLGKPFPNITGTSLYSGDMDEVSIYQRALTGSEIKAIHDNGASGKFDTNAFTSSPSLSLAEAGVGVNGEAPTNFLGANTGWQENSIAFTATSNSTPVQISGVEPGILLDSFVMSNATVTVSNITTTFMVTNVVTNFTYLTFTEDTNLTTTPIKYAVPPFVPPTDQLSVASSSSLNNFESSTAGDYSVSSTVDGWRVVSNQVSVASDTADSMDGSNFLALANGTISNSLSTVPGKNYKLTFYTRGPKISGWWRGENNANDLINGNSGLLLGNASYTSAKVGQGFNLDGNQPSCVNIPYNPDLITSNYTVEAWIDPTAQVTGGIGQTLIFGQSFGHLQLVVRTGTTGVWVVLQFGIDHFTFFKVQSADEIPIGQFTHVAGTWDGSKLRLYINGVLNAESTPGASPADSGCDFFIGGFNSPDANSCQYVNQFFHGVIDELGYYGRALSASEIKAIANLGSAGKFDPSQFNISPSESLAEADVSVPGVTNDVVLGNNTVWRQESVAFKATGTSTPVVIRGLEPGMLLDSFALSELALDTNSSLYYQPEQSLDPLLGTSAYGLWQLEVLDNRTGATNDANLVSWQLQFTFANTNFTLGTITNGFPGAQTNFIPGNSIQWFLVNVPTNADYATNTLIFANLPLNLWWSTNEPPTTTNVPPDAEILAGSQGGSAVLGTNGSPVNATTAFIIPGGHYYLGVENPNAGGTEYAVNVTFHLLTGQLPSVITEPATNIVTGSATLNASVNPLGTNATVYFEYGLTTNYGFFSTNVVLTSNLNQAQWVPINVTNIAPPGSVWHFQAIATNSFGTNYGGDLIWTNPYNTPPPFAFTMPPTRVNGSSAQFNGMATPNGAPAKAWFDWGTSTRYGFSTPAVDVGTNFSVVYVTNFMSSFQTNVAFHYRLVVSNGVAVTYGFDQVFAEGSVVAWGADFFGQTTPLPAGLTNLVAGVGAGFDFSLALNYDGSVVAWGNDTLGQTNVPAGLNNAVAVAGGYSHALALRSDRTVTAWGDDSDGQTNVPPSLTNAVAAASGAYHNLVLRDNGNLVAWGLDSSGQGNIPAGLSNVVAVAAGYSHSLALKNDGTVVAWGNNAHGETNVPAGLTNVVAIAAGNYDSLALRSNGTVVVWGYNANGQTNVPVSLTNVTAIAAGGYHCLALKGDGSVWFWGDSSSGQLNNYPTNLVNNIFTIAGGGFHTVAVSAPYGLNVTNTPPYWTNGLDGTTNTMDELTVATIDNAARDSNSPPQLVFYSLLNPPAFASIDSFSGVITLNPQEVDGPGTNIITTVATDNGYPTLSATNRFTLIVNEVNTPPFWPAGVPNPTNYVIGVGSTLTVNDIASDSDMPANALTYAVTVSPSANPPAIANGIITWTPQTAGNFTLTTVVTDDNPWALTDQNLSATNYITVTVTNSGTPPPVIVTNISSIVYTNINGTNGFLLTWLAPSNELFQVQCTTSLSPVVWQTFTNIISYNPDYPADATNATFTFFDDGSQIPFGTMRFYRVIQYGSGGGNTAPVLPAIGTQTVNPLNPLTVTNTATDSDTPAQVLTYSLSTTVTGTNQPVINPATGIITWTPDLSQAGTTNTFVTVVTDSGVPAMSATNAFDVIVNPVPELTGVTSTNGGFLLTWYAPTNDIFEVQFTDGLSPINWQSFSNLVTYTGPVTPTNGLFSFFDDGTEHPFTGLRFYQVKLVGVILPTNPPSGNTAPVLPAIGTQTVNPLNPLTVTNTATDSDTPAQTLTYALSTTVTGTNPPVINPATGIITWTPDVSQAGTSNWFTTVVTDDGVPAMRATNAFAVMVNPVPDITGVVATNGGVRLTWLAPTNDIFQVQFTDGLNPVNWQSFSNLVTYTGPQTPTNGLFSFFDDGTEHPFNGLRFYQVKLVGLVAPTNPPAVSTAFPISVVPSNGNFVLTWTASSTNQFKVLWTTNISSPITWTPFADIITSSNGTFTFTDTNAPAALKFYQLMLLP